MSSTFLVILVLHLHHVWHLWLIVLSLKKYCLIGILHRPFAERMKLATSCCKANFKLASSNKKELDVNRKRQNYMRVKDLILSSTHIKLDEKVYIYKSLHCYYLIWPHIYYQKESKLKTVKRRITLKTEPKPSETC